MTDLDHELTEAWCERCQSFCYSPIEGALSNLCNCCDERVRADERERILQAGGTYWDIPKLITDERERIAQAIEAESAKHDPPMSVVAMAAAARIARNGGRDALA